MFDPTLDRRKNGRFRILYIDFRAFWSRYVLRKKAPQEPPAAIKAPVPPSRQSSDDPVGLKSYSTGITKIDEQHLEIREAILNLQKYLRSGVTGPPLIDAMESLLQLMNGHFQYEESYLEHIKAPDLAHYRAERDQFRNQVQRMEIRAEAEDQGVSLELSAFLLNWFRDHIQDNATFAKGHRPR